MKRSLFILSFLFAIVNLQAQDYLIGFSGKGSSTTVDAVKIENLTQGKTFIVGGSDILHLVERLTDVNPGLTNAEKSLRIYPNPMTESSTIEFMATAPGKTSIELFDVTGKRIEISQTTLNAGIHSFRINGLNTGFYVVKIKSPNYTYAGNLVSNRKGDENVTINYLGHRDNIIAQNKLKSGKSEKEMQYTSGDLLKFTGMSGIYNTILTDIPTQSKTIAFAFVACTDPDGNLYSVVQIGTQLWMAENLKSVKYRNSDPIDKVTDDIQWRALTTGAYCNYNNNTAYANIYGRLYNWYAVKDSRNIAPMGWHIPTDAEWTTLANYLGGIAVAGGKLKETGIDHWKSPNVGATNESGFTALAGGMRDGNSWYDDFGLYGHWWSSTQSDANNAWGRGIYYNYGDIGSSSFGKSLGYSVRCIKD
jgi:uncharacterized protein (TIGR02145 family)